MQCFQSHERSFVHPWRPNSARGEQAWGPSQPALDLVHLGYGPAVFALSLTSVSQLQALSAGKGAIKVQNGYLSVAVGNRAPKPGPGSPKVARRPRKIYPEVQIAPNVVVTHRQIMKAQVIIVHLDADGNIHWGSIHPLKLETGSGIQEFLLVPLPDINRQIWRSQTFCRWARLSATIHVAHEQLHIFPKSSVNLVLAVAYL